MINARNVAGDDLGNWEQSCTAMHVDVQVVGPSAPQPPHRVCNISPRDAAPFPVDLLSRREGGQ